MKILTNKQVNEIYAELKELKASIAQNEKSDMAQYLEDLKHIDKVAYTIGGTRGMLKILLDKYPAEVEREKQHE